MATPEEEKLLAEYESFFAQNNLHMHERQQLFIENYNKFKQKFERLSELLQKVSAQIKEYENCVRTLQRIEESSYRDTYEPHEQEELQSDHQKNENLNSEKTGGRREKAQEK